MIKGTKRPKDEETDKSEGEEIIIDRGTVERKKDKSEGR